MLVELEIGAVLLEATLVEGPGAERLLAACPCESIAEPGDGVVVFALPLQLHGSTADRWVLEAGEIGFDPRGWAYVAYRDVAVTEIETATGRAPTGLVLLAQLDSDAALLAAVSRGDAVRVTVPDPES